MTTKLILVGLLVLAASGCDHDYTGHYDMTYSAVFDGDGREVVGGNSVIEVREGLEDEWLIDLGGDFCRLVATYEREAAGLPPYLAVQQQPCAFGDATMMMVSGYATSFDHEQSWEEIRFTVALRGIYARADGADGIVTLDLNEAW
jgi:hypothetical protein